MVLNGLYAASPAEGATRADSGRKAGARITAVQRCHGARRAAADGIRRAFRRSLLPAWLAAAATARAASGQVMTIEEYQPRSTLVVPGTTIHRARFPFVDVHNHQWGQLTAERVDSLVQAMDRLNMHVMVNLSGGTGDSLAQRVRATEGRYPGRFVTFANLDFSGFDQPGWGERAARQLHVDVRRNGARGLKIYKELGLDLRDREGRRVAPNDPRLDPIWRMAGELEIPVLIHTGEPRPFFDPHDALNERWLELKQFPNRARPADRYPPWEQVMAEQHDLFRRFPETTFIAAHLGWLGNDLARLGELLDAYPNVYTEVAAVVAELGRQPRYARAFFIRYQDRLLFGKDTWAEDEYHTYFRIFETADEYFPYFRRRHAFWQMYGLYLPDDVLAKFYYSNAARIIPGLAGGPRPSSPAISHSSDIPPAARRPAPAFCTRD